jgi:hypothetical protein
MKQAIADPKFALRQLCRAMHLDPMVALRHE